MKRTIGIAVLTLFVLVCIWTLAPAQGLNYLTAVTMQARAWIFSALQTFGARITVRGPASTPTGTVVSVQNNPATPAIGDNTAINFELKNDASNYVGFGNITSQATDIGAGTYAGYLSFLTATAASKVERMRLDSTGLMGPSAGLLPMPSGATITGGSHADATAVNVTAGSRVGLEGAAGDTYTVRTAATASLDTYRDGVLAGQNRGTHWILADCPASPEEMEFGSVCKQISTGKILYRGTLEAVP